MNEYTVISTSICVSTYLFVSYRQPLFMQQSAATWWMDTHYIRPTLAWKMLKHFSQFTDTLKFTVKINYAGGGVVKDGGPKAPSRKNVIV